MADDFFMWAFGTLVLIIGFFLKKFYTKVESIDNNTRETAIRLEGKDKEIQYIEKRLDIIEKFITNYIKQN